MQFCVLPLKTFIAIIYSKLHSRSCDCLRYTNWGYITAFKFKYCLQEFGSWISIWTLLLSPKYMPFPHHAYRKNFLEISIENFGSSEKLQKLLYHPPLKIWEFLSTIFNNIFETNFNSIFLCHSVHAKAGETVLVHGASGGVGKYYFLFSIAVSFISFYQWVSVCTYAI